MKDSMKLGKNDMGQLLHNHYNDDNDSATDTILFTERQLTSLSWLMR